MKSLNNNDWIFINDLIYRLNSTNDVRSLQKIFLSSISSIIVFDRAAFYLASDFSETGAPVSVNVPQPSIENYAKYMNSDYTKWIFSLSKSMVYRESDMWTDAERENTLYYQKMYAPIDIHYVLTMGLIHENEFMGCCSFYNAYSHGDFSDHTLNLLDVLKDHIALAIYQRTKGKKSLQDPVAVEQYATEIDLTKKEKEVFHLLLTDLTTEEICQQLFISPNTLKNHLQNIYNKADVKNKFQLLKKASLL